MKKIVALLMMFLMLPWVAGAQTQVPDVSYVECSWDGSSVVTTSKTVMATVVTVDDTQWGADDGNEHWYVVNGNIAIQKEGYKGITIIGDVHLILKDNSSLTVYGSIKVDNGNSFSIYGQSEGMGKLIAHRGNGFAAIGSDSDVEGGRITIHGGDIEVEPSKYNSIAGIGGGNKGKGGVITIYGGTVSASGGGAGIGGSNGDNLWEIFIYGGTVIANGGDSAAGIGGGNGGDGGKITILGGNITAAGGEDAAGIGSGEINFATGKTGGEITITGGYITATGGGDGGAGIGGGYHGDGGNIIIKGGNITAKGTNYGAGIGGGHSSSGGVINISGGEIKAEGNQTTQWGASAGIGGGYQATGGEITISGGKITAIGGSVTNNNIGAAGIGGGISASCGSVTITGGEVIATGGGTASGIGGGSNYNYTEGSAQGSIAISGGKVTATGGGGFGIGESGGTFSTGESGNAFITSNGISGSDDKTGWSGIFFEDGNNEGFVYGNPTLEFDVEITSGKTLTITEGSSLTIGEGVTLTNNGTINSSGSIINYGTIAGTGTEPGVVLIGLTKEMIELEYEECVYDGTEKKPTVKVSKGDKTYVIDTDYTVSYSNNTDAGEATVTVTPEGSNIGGEPVSIPFTIKQAPALEDNENIGPAEGYSNNVSITTDKKSFTLSVVANVGSKGSWEWSVTPVGIVEIDKVEAIEGSKLKDADVSSSNGNKSQATFNVLGTGTAKITAMYKNNNYEDSKVEFSVSVSTPPVVVTYHDLHITESVGAKLVSRNDKDRTPDGGSFTLSLEKEEGYEDCEPTVYYKRGRFGEWNELKLDEVSGYYQIRSVYTDIYVKVSGDGIWPVSNEEVEAQEVKVYTQNGTIVVSTPSMMDVQIISMTGAQVAADKVAGQREFRNLAEGIYVVRVGDKIVKVRL